MIFFLISVKIDKIYLKVSNLKKLIVKTAIITLACVLGLILLTFGALAIFSPVTLANVFDKTGSYSASVYFYEKNYQNSGDIDDLALLTIKIDQDLDGEKAEEYLAKLVRHEDFIEFCASEQGGEVFNKQFYVGNYAVVLVKNSKLIDAIDVAEIFVLENGYTDFNPYSVLLIEEGENLSVEDLDLIKGKLHVYLDAFPSSQNTVNDINYIDQLKAQK